MSRLAGLLCLLCALGVLSSPALAVPTVEELFKMMAEREAEVKTMQGDVNVVVNTPAGPIKGGGRAVTARSEEDGKTIEKLFVSVKMTVKVAERTMTTETRTVNDGQFMWQEVRNSMPPSVQIIKKSGDSHMAGVSATMLTSEKDIDALRKLFDFKTVAEDVIDGRKVYLLQAGRRKNPQGPGFRIWSLESGARYYVDQEELYVRRFVTYDAQGTEIIRFELTNVKLNEKVDPKLFEYTPPKGVEIIDKTVESADK